MSSRTLGRALPLLTCLALIAGCSGSPRARVVRMESGAMRVVGTARNIPDARLAAVDEAGRYCKQQKREPVFRSQSLLEEKKKGIDLSKIPVIGKAFEGIGREQVTLSFRCGRPTDASG